MSSLDDGDSAAISQAVAAEFLSGPQRSIHTAAEQQQHNVLLQQAVAVNSNSVPEQQPGLDALGGLSPAALAAANEETSAVNKRDIFKAIFVSGTACVLAGILDHAWVEAHQVK